MVRVLLALMCSVPGAVVASDWMTVARAANGMEHAIDLESFSVLSAEGAVFEVWDRVKLPQPTSVRFRMGPSLVGETYNNFRRLTVHDCKRHAVEVHEIRLYNDEWLVKEAAELPGLVSAPFGLAPGSVGEKVHKRVCTLRVTSTP